VSAIPDTEQAALAAEQVPPALSVPVAPTEPPAGSLSARVAQRRAERERKRSEILTIPVVGFEDLLAASYRRLSFEQKGGIVHRHDGIGSDTNVEIAAAADFLINACTDLLEVTGEDENGKPTYQSLGKRWTTASIANLFEMEFTLNTSVRTAMLAAFDHDDLNDHFLAYTRGVAALDKSDSEELPGESEPSEEG
jgi:hypothetical protein